MKKILLLSALWIASGYYVVAQNRSVSGTVTDQATSTGIAGVNVSVKDSALGTLTDASGNFTLSVPNAVSSLIFSFVGYTTQQVPIPPSGTLNVSLVEETSELEEIVISVGSR